MKIVIGWPTRLYGCISLRGCRRPANKNTQETNLLGSDFVHVLISGLTFFRPVCTVTIVHAVDGVFVFSYCLRTSNIQYVNLPVKSFYMPRNPHMVYVTFECTPEFKERLEALGREELRSMSSQIRRMLSDWMANRAAGPQAQGGDSSAWDAVPPASSTFGVRPKVKPPRKSKVSNE